MDLSLEKDHLDTEKVLGETLHRQRNFSSAQCVERSHLSLYSATSVLYNLS